ncbi:hypothetical protein ACTA71_004393 [Dictyostelium dimigraforme]
MDNNNELFFKIWRCVIIKNEILFHLGLYNKHLNLRFHFNNQDISKYKFKSYLNKIKIFLLFNEIEIKGLEGSLPYGISDIKISNEDILSLSTIFNKESSMPTSVQTIKFCDNIKLDKVNILPQSITSIKFGKSYNEKISIGVLPSSVKTIKFGYNYNQPLEVGVLPSSLTSIKFGNSFNQPLDNSLLSSSSSLSSSSNIKSLKFGKDFKQSIKDINYLQKSLTSLVIPIDYKELIDSNLISSLVPLKFDENLELCCYNSNSNLLLLESNPIISNTITKLKFDNRFNQILKSNQIPNSVTSIIFGNNFNSLIQTNSLSSNLSTIEFGKFFNSPFNFQQLVNLKTIKFGNYFKQKLEDCCFPPNLTSLTFGNSFDSEIPGGYFLNIPLKRLVCGKFFNKPIDVNKTLPSTLKYLDLGYSKIFNSYKQLSTPLPKLESLIMGKGYNGILGIGDLPSSLKELSLSSGPKQSLEKGIIPNGITSLSLGDSFNQSIESNILPNSIKNLSFGLKFNQPIKINTLPCQLTSLSFDYHFNQPIEIGILPNSLTSLSFLGAFNQIFKVGSLPNSITHLSLYYFYSQDFPIGSLPSSLKQLRIHSSNFNQDLSSSFDDYFTSSLETIYISKNSNLINILDPNFFSKYIKFNIFNNK